MTLAWHFTSYISRLTLAPVGSQGDPPDWSWGKSASSGSFSARLPTPLTVCRLDWLWPIALSLTTLLLESEPLKVHNVSFLRLLLLGLPGMFCMEKPLWEWVSWKMFCGSLLRNSLHVFAISRSLIKCDQFALWQSNSTWLCVEGLCHVATLRKAWAMTWMADDLAAERVTEVSTSRCTCRLTP